MPFSFICYIYFNTCSQLTWKWFFFLFSCFCYWYHQFQALGPPTPKLYLTLLSPSRFIHMLSYNELVAQPCPTLWDPMDCNLPGSSVHGILQARILEWVATPFSRESSQPRDWTWVPCTAGGFCIFWATWDAPMSNNAAQIVSLQFFLLRYIYSTVLISFKCFLGFSSLLTLVHPTH